MTRLIRVIIWSVLLQAAWAADLSTPAPAQGVPNAQPGLPAFTVAPAQSQSKYYPCSRCHKFMEPNPQPRKLKAPHPELKHGSDAMWCLSCHDPTNRDMLRTFVDEPVAFESAYRVCGQCHAVQLRDWYAGAHGKRVANWRGKREIYNCSHCHDPHDPGIKPRQPLPPPPVRMRLGREDGQNPGKATLWQRYFLEGDEYRP